MGFPDVGGLELRRRTGLVKMAAGVVSEGFCILGWLIMAMGGAQTTSHFFFLGGGVVKCGIFSAAERGFGAVVFESNGHGVKEREVRERRRVVEMGLGFGWDEAEILMRESGVVLGVWGLDSLLSFYSEFVGYMVLTENWFKREPL